MTAICERMLGIDKHDDRMTTERQRVDGWVILSMGKYEGTAVTFNRTVGAMEKRVMTSAKKLEILSVSSRKMTDLDAIDPGCGTTQHFNVRHDDAV